MIMYVPSKFNVVKRLTVFVETLSGSSCPRIESVRKCFLTFSVPMCVPLFVSVFVCVTVRVRARVRV